MENATIWKQILVLFEFLSGLKINFNKSSLFGLNVSRDSLKATTESVVCTVGEFPFTYLGMKVGFQHRKVAEWAYLVDKVTKKLRVWEDKQVSMAGRITLLNSVLSSIPIYYFSFFLIPKKILKDLERVQHEFLWGGGAEVKKVAWID